MEIRAPGRGPLRLQSRRQDVGTLAIGLVEPHELALDVLGEHVEIASRPRHRPQLAERTVQGLGPLCVDVAPGGPQKGARPSGGDAVLVSHHVREAMLALDELVGVVDVEEVLGKVFAGFCVGK